MKKLLAVILGLATLAIFDGALAAELQTATVSEVVAKGRQLTRPDVEVLAVGSRVTRYIPRGVRYSTHSWVCGRDGSVQGFTNDRGGETGAVRGMGGTGTCRIDDGGRLCTTVQMGMKVEAEPVCRFIFEFGGAYWGVARKNPKNPDAPAILHVFVRSSEQ